MKGWSLYQSRRGAAFAAVSTVLSLASTATLLSLPGRSSEYSTIEPEEAAASPGTAGFSLGRLHWDMRRYAEERRFDPLRAYLAEVCPSKVGLDAAKCLTDHFARAFPHGVPAHEFVDSEYDPVADLKAHLAGAPGHCVTRSGLIAAILLASGIPARQVQVVPWSRFAHNAVEVYDPKWHWVVIDPSFGTIAQTAEGPASAWYAVLHHARARRIAAGVLPQVAAIDKADVRYPDPWLYMRSGESAAHWPFRGLFSYVGAPQLWEFGRAQIILRRAAVLFAGLAVVLKTSSKFSRAKKVPASIAAGGVGQGQERPA